MVLCVLLCLVAYHAQAQSINGEVLSTEGVAIAGAFVEVHETGQSTFSSASGMFVLNDLAKGHYHLHVRCAGFKSFAADVECPSGSLRIVLQPTDIELSEVTIENSFSKSEYARQSLDMTVIDRAGMDRMRGMTLSQSLGQLAGVNAVSTGVGIAKPVIRGLQGNRIVVNDQGIKQEGQQWGNDHGLELDQFSIERLELVKGAASLQYGSDGLGGVINVLPAGAPEEGWHGGVQMLARTNNSLLGTSAMITYRKSRFFIRYRSTLQRYGDYRVPATSFTYLNRTLPIEAGRLRNTAGEEWHHQLAVGFMGEKVNWTLTLSRFQQRSGLFPGIVGIPTYGNVRDDGNAFNIDLPLQNVQHHKAILNLSRQMRKGWLQVDAGVQHNARREDARPHVDGYGPMPTTTMAHRLELFTAQATARYHLRHNERWKSVPGVNVQYQQNRRGGFEFLLPNYNTYNAGAWWFSEWSRHSKSTVWNAGVRYDVGHMQATAFNALLYDVSQQPIGLWQRSPNVQRQFQNVSAAIGFSKVWRQVWSFKMNAGKTFRIPNGAEMLSNGVHHGTWRHEQGDASLKAEQGYQLDATAGIERERWKLHFTPYFNYFSGYIYLRPTARFSELPDGGQVYRYTQNDALFTGAEFTGEWHPLRPLHLEVSADYVFSYNLQTTLALPFTPPFRARTQAMWEKEGEHWKWYGGMQAWAVAAQNRVDRNEWTTPGYFLIDALAGISRQWKHHAVSLRLTLSNATDRRYMNHLSLYRRLMLPEQGRNLALSVVWEF